MHLNQSFYETILNLLHIYQHVDRLKHTLLIQIYLKGGSIQKSNIQDEPSTQSLWNNLKQHLESYTIIMALSLPQEQTIKNNGNPFIDYFLLADLDTYLSISLSW